MIIDSHVHIFPHLSGPCGFETAAQHMLYLQKFTADTPAQAARNARDGSVARDREAMKLWDDEKPGFDGAHDVNFRVGRFGRLEWTKGNDDYFIHLYSPSLQEMEAPAEFLLAEMDYAGVDVAVLQNAWLYGQLNGFFAEAVRKYPHRFVGSVQVNEARADRNSEIDELRRAVNDLGLRALYFANVRYFESGYQDQLDDEKFFPFWEEVRDLGIPVYWDLTATPFPGRPDASSFERFMEQMRRFDRWQAHFPSIPSILVHGVPLRYIRSGDGFKPIPDEIWNAWMRPNVHLEILFPMQVSHPAPGASAWEYPYPQVQPLIRELYRRLGAEKLVWGSDMPNTERNCTYRQALEYLTHYCDFISERDMSLIVAGNAVRLLKIGRPADPRVRQ